MNAQLNVGSSPQKTGDTFRDLCMYMAPSLFINTCDVYMKREVAVISVRLYGETS